MAKTLDAIFQNDKDFDLCNELVDFVQEQCEDNIDVSHMPVAHRTVWLVWTSHGLIMNGGFRRLFEGYFEGDLDFQLTLRAYEAIECVKAIEAFRASLAYFPDSIPPLKPSMRVRHYLKQFKVWPTPEDLAFFKLSDDIERDLARYARSHRNEFQVRSKRAKERTPIGSRLWNWIASKFSRPKEQLDLPHWVGIAFAAHCAESVLPELDACWPGMSDKRMQSLQQAIDIARRSATYGQRVEGLNDAIIQSRICAGRALMGGADDEEGEPGPPDGHLGTVASFIANACATAAEAVEAEPGQSAYSALQSLSFACDAFESLDHDDRADELRVQYHKLFESSVRKKWTNRTTLPMNYRFGNSF